MITLSTLVFAVIYLLVAACVIGLLYYLVQIVPIAEPYKAWVKVAFTVLVVLFIIGFLLSLVTGVPFITVR